MNAQSKKAAQTSILTEQKEIERLSGYLDWTQFERVVDAIAQRSKVITCASGTSGIAAKKFAHSLCCIEIDAIFMPPSEAVHGGMGCVKKNDVVVFVSRGGKTSELLPIMQVCKQKEALLVLLTEQPNSPLGKLADIALTFAVEKESDPLNIMSTASFVATIAVFDALLAALIVETGYTLTQFGLIHPGGAVGEQLSDHPIP